MTKEKVIDILEGIKDGTACLMLNMPEDGEKAIDIAIKAVEQFEPPTIQPEIIYCKDCKYGVLDHDFPHQYFCKFKGNDWNNGDHFCGHAKKKGETI